MEIRDIFGIDGPLARALPDYERRSGQEEMAVAVASAFMGAGPDGNGAADNLLVVEAETGIGKTLAYLIPSVLSGRKVVISTATLNLQDQIIDKDIPLVEQILDVPLSTVCVKGRENYLCLYRWYQYRSNPQLSLASDPGIEKIDSWLKMTSTGDRAELGWLGERSLLWPRISARANQCLGGECPEAAGCFVSQLRKRAGAANLLVVNHHLFFSDLSLKREGHGEVLPRYEAVVFDEAHHVENVASTFFGKSFSHYQVLDLAADIEQLVKLELPQGIGDGLLSSLVGLTKRVESFLGIFPVKTGRYPLEAFIADFSEKLWRENVESLASGIARLSHNLSEFSGYGESWVGFRSRADELEALLTDIGLGTTEKEESVHWYERRERSVVLSLTPVEVAPILAEYLFAKVDTCILTSATLSSGGSFSYLKNRLGLDDTATTFLQFSSPFNYQNNGLIYIPEPDFPEPTAHNFHSVLAERLVELLYISQGRALILCTSYRGMNEIAEILTDKLDYPLLVQGSESRSGLLRRFREETHSVLVAVASFWEGVDVVGEALSCVVIDKLPFEVPSDPVIQARIERIREQGGNPFFSFQVPRAVLTLRQGVGRLMRSNSDSGVIGIMDVRLYKKGYGKTFLKSLPSAPIVREVAEIETFFRKLLEEKD